MAKITRSRLTKTGVSHREPVLVGDGECNTLFFGVAGTDTFQFMVRVRGVDGMTKPSLFRLELDENEAIKVMGRVAAALGYRLERRG